MLTPEQEAHNAEIVYWREIDRETPAKRWFYASLERAPIYRALRISPGDHGAAYAVAPFRIGKDSNDQWAVLAAWPCPTIEDEDWLGIQVVIAWNPNSDRAEVLGDVAPQLIGGLTVDANQIHASPRVFFQQWAIRRAQYLAMRQTTSAHWDVPPAEHDEVPGVLVVGDPDRIRWNPTAMPEHIECVGIDPARINRALLRAARIPRAVAAQSHIRSAA